MTTTNHTADNRFDEGTFILGGEVEPGFEPAGWVETPGDQHGEILPICRACIEADSHDALWMDAEEWAPLQCACCGQTADDQP